MVTTINTSNFVRFTITIVVVTVMSN